MHSIRQIATLLYIPKFHFHVFTRRNGFPVIILVTAAPFSLMKRFIQYMRGSTNDNKNRFTPCSVLNDFASFFHFNDSLTNANR